MNVSYYGDCNKQHVMSQEIVLLTACCVDIYFKDF